MGRDGFGCEAPRQSPQTRRRIATGGQGAQQLQLPKREQLFFGGKAELDPCLAALERKDYCQLGATGLLYADQVAAVELRGRQRISPRGSRRAARPRCGPA